MMKALRLIAALLFLASAPTVAEAGGLTGYPTPGQFPGSPNSTPANAGNMGQTVSCSVNQAGAVTQSNGVGMSDCSVSLSPGHWQCSGSVQFVGASTTTVLELLGRISSTNGGVAEAQFGYTNLTYPSGGSAIFGGSTNIDLPVPPIDILLSTTTTEYLNSYGNYGTSTLKAYGGMLCTRVQ